MPIGHPLTEEQISYVRANFKNKTNNELASDIGVSRSTICRIQRRYRLTKSAEHIHNMGVRAGMASVASTGGRVSQANTPEAIAKRAATYKKTRDTEEIRYKWGLLQLTKIRLMKEPRAKKDQRHNLIRRGYIVDEKNLIAYYDSGTDRSWRLERRNASSHFKSYYHFRPYDGEQ